ncbi:MAG: VOC family protein [Chloroflexota bacterium]
MPTVVPMLAYENGPAAMDWLISAFGFVERERWLDAEGRLSHGELAAGEDGIVMLATPTPLYESPARHREHCDATAAWSAVPFVIDGVLVAVADLDALFERAKAAGANILSEPETAGDGTFRLFRVEDLEGHRWMFTGP